MTLLHDDDSVRVDIYLRTSVAGVVEARQSEVLDRVEQLQRTGVLDDVSVSYWSSTVPAPDEGGCPDVISELYEFTTDTAYSLSPFFREREGRDETRTTLFVPIVCLVVRRESAIDSVFPSTYEGRYRSIEDGIRALEANEPLASAN